MEATIKTTSRARHLDGLRGIACLMVVALHYSICLQPHLRIEFYFDGVLSVAVFFLMSGFILTDASAPQYRLDSLIAARLFRLLIPVFVAICLGRIIYGLCYPLAHSTALITGSPLLLATTLTPSNVDIPGSMLAALVGFKGVSLFPVSSFIGGGASSDNPIWTISYEVYGSILTFALTRIYHVRRPWWFLAITASLCAFGIRELGLFVIGHIARIVWRYPQGARWNYIALAFGACAIAAYSALHINLFYDPPRLEIEASGLVQHYSPLGVSHAVGGIIIFFVVIYSSMLQRLLTLKPLLYLGRLSFSIYLLHWPVLLSFGCGLYLLIGNRSTAATWVVFVAGAVVTGTIAVAFERYIDAPAIALSRRIRELGTATMKERDPATPAWKVTGSAD